MPNQRKLAVFDVDGVIYKGSLGAELLHALTELGHIAPHVREGLEKEKAEWLVKKKDYDTYHQIFIRTFVKNAKGLHYGDFAEAARVLVEKQHKRVFRYSTELVHKLKSDGYFLLAISHSPKTIVDELCLRFDFDKTYGIVFELGPQDRFTGKILEEQYIMNKGAALRRAIEKQRLSLEGSIGIGDTEPDIPFLEMVEKPTAFNPNSKLHRHAKRLGWKIVVERKDVIYEM